MLAQRFTVTAFFPLFFCLILLAGSSLPVFSEPADFTISPPDATITGGEVMQNDENQSPTVTFTEPLDNAAYAQGATITMSCDPVDPDGEIDHVTYWNGVFNFDRVSYDDPDYTVTSDPGELTSTTGSWWLNVNAYDDQDAMGYNYITYHVIGADIYSLAVSESQEENPGIFIPLHDSSELSDSIGMYFPGAFINNQLYQYGSGLLTKTEIGTGKLKCWDTTTRQTEYQLPLTPTSFWDIPGYTYIEGTSVSNNLRDVTLTLSYTLNSSTCSDSINITVAKVDFPVPYNVENGQTITGKAHVYPDTAGTYVTYESSDENIASVIGTGNSFNITGNALGTVYVIAKINGQEFGRGIVIVDSTRTKLPLGRSLTGRQLYDNNKYKVFVPTKYGGKLTISSDHCIIGNITNPQGYIVNNGDNLGMNCNGWYTFEVTPVYPNTEYDIESTFEQSGDSSKQPWPCPWYPIAEDIAYPHLYDSDGALDKYDNAYNAQSNNKALNIEKCNYYIGGNYVAHHIIREDDAEVTMGYDFNNADQDNDPLTGIQNDIAVDLGSPVGYGENYHDDTYNAVFDFSGIGHCDGASCAIVLENEPTGTFIAPNQVSFEPSDKKGLLVALYYHDPVLHTDGPNITPNIWQYWLEKYILEYRKMFVSDIENSNMIWNYPIYGIKSSFLQERTGQTDENVVEVTCQVKVWKSTESDITYNYNVTYADGTTENLSYCEWTSQDYPDTVWEPAPISSINTYWQDTLNLATIRTIVPAP